MKNTRILSIAVVLLMITNIVLVAFMMTNKKKSSGREPRPDPTAVIIKEMNMTPEQEQTYRRLKDEHMKNVKPLFDSVRAAKKAFFGLSKNPMMNDSLVSVYGNRLCEKQAALDKMTLNHFREVRNVFTAEQQPRYDSLIQKMMQRGKKDSAKKGK